MNKMRRIFEAQMKRMHKLSLLSSKLMNKMGGGDELVLLSSKLMNKMGGGG